MTFPVETLTTIQRTACEAQTPHEVDTNDPRRRHFFVKGDHHEIKIPPPKRDHTVSTPTDLVAFARLYTARRAHEADLAPPAVLWVSDSGASLILDDNDRRDAVDLLLPWDPIFEAVLKLAEPGRPPFTQAAFVRFLRLSLGLGEDEITPWRHLKWQSRNDTATGVGTQGESLGREVLAHVEGREGDLPQEVKLSGLGVYSLSDLATPAVIRLAIEVDAPEQRIHLAPLPGEIEDARHFAVDTVVEFIRERLVDPDGPGDPVENVEVYRGEF